MEKEDMAGKMFKGITSHHDNIMKLIGSSRKPSKKKELDAFEKRFGKEAQARAWASTIKHNPHLVHDHPR